MAYVYYTLVTLLITVAVLLILLILIQKGRGGGLSGAFGGGGGSSAFGAKTGDVLTWATSIIFGIFILLAVALDLVVNSQYKSALTQSSSAPPVLPINEPENSAPVTPETTPPTTAGTQPGLQLPTTLPTTASAANLQGNYSGQTSVTIPPTFTTGPVGSIPQVIKTATTQAVGTVRAATQPAGKLINGARPGTK